MKNIERMQKKLKNMEKMLDKIIDLDHEVMNADHEEESNITMYGLILQSLVPAMYGCIRFMQGELEIEQTKKTKGENP